MKMSAVKRSWSLPDLQHYKALRSNSNQAVPSISGSPWLMLFPNDGGCLLYNPDEDKFHSSLRDFSGTRILTSYGNWFLVLDLARSSSLYIIDVFSGNRIDLPPLDSVRSDIISGLKRVGDTEFRLEHTDGSYSSPNRNAHSLRGRLWVAEKAEEFVVVWFFDVPPGYLYYCKKGIDHYTVISLRDQVPKSLRGLSDLVLRGYRLYILSIRRFVRVIDLSGEEGFEDVTESNPSPMFSPHRYDFDFNLAVTSAGEVLLVESTTFENHRSFRLYKKDPNADQDDYSPVLEVDSLGDEALLLDLGITVPANRSLGMKPNSIYFTRHDRARLRSDYELDICVSNIANNILKRFSHLAKMNIKDAQWFLPGFCSS